MDELGSHHMFLAEVVAVNVDEKYMDERDTFHLSKAKPLAYSHGRYYGLGELLGTFGYSVKKKDTSARGKKTPVKSAGGNNPTGAKVNGAPLKYMPISAQTGEKQNSGKGKSNKRKNL